MIDLIAGGARSGKSRHALELARSSDRVLHIIATAQALDSAMSERIRRHQSERGAEWTLVEEPKYLSALVDGFGARDTIVVDCLTLWLSNWLSADDASAWAEEKQAFLSAIADSSAHWILVTNETGMGVIPMGELSRQFIDESGWLHQQIAQIADHVTLVMFGIPQVLK